LARRRSICTATVTAMHERRFASWPRSTLRCSRGFVTGCWRLHPSIPQRSTRVSRPRKKLGIETDVWAFVRADGSLPGGDWRPYVFWTAKRAKEHADDFPASKLVRARIVLVAEHASE
jgi:hypothetical protein